MSAALILQCFYSDTSGETIRSSGNHVSWIISWLRKESDLEHGGDVWMDGAGRTDVMNGVM